MKQSVLFFLTGIAFGFIGGLLLAPPVHADANSYLAYIHNNGINTGAFTNDAWLLDNGNRTCVLLRQGMSVDQIASGISFADKRGLTLAAQHELCPDTLH